MHKLLILDGGMGTMIQRYGLQEADYRGTMFAAHAHALKGNNDVLPLTRPDVIGAIHREYLRAGADIIETCTFNANAVSQAEYGLSAHVRTLNLAAARVARQAADEVSAERGCRLEVAGSVGPTSVSLSMAADVDDPGKRSLEFDVLAAAYEEQIDALIEGGVDRILVETCFDTLNAKAACYAFGRVCERRNCQLPLMISASLADKAGRLLSGQTLEAFIHTMVPFGPASIGLNCGFGVQDMMSFLPILVKNVPQNIAISCYPNAGLPDADGGYHDDAAETARILGEAAQKGWLDIAGGCCGTTPQHIAAIAKVFATIDTRETRKPDFDHQKQTVFTGLEAFKTGQNRMIIAERANVAGSRKFRRMIEEKTWDEALDIARKQMKLGNAHLVDVCMDAPMLDAKAAMTEFLRRMAAEADIARYPVCIDSSDFEVVRAGLRQCQGRCLVNSISLKEGTAEFLKKAKEIKDLGAAVVVMAFDEQGQASNTRRRIEILSRAIDLLIQEAGYRLTDIVIDPNILAIGTGMEEHADQAISFVECCTQMLAKYPGIQTVGGLSNLSFSFRGRDDVRQAIHAEFLTYADKALTMVIANPTDPSADQLPETSPRQLAHDLVHHLNPRGTENMLAWMAQNQPQKTKNAQIRDDLAKISDPAQRLCAALTRGETTYLEQDIATLAQKMTPLQVIEGPLMTAMNEVGQLFGAGRMFLPQIVKAARMMKQAIAYLELPETTAEEPRLKKRVLIATVFGDVHDIGKNIVNVVLTCNGYEVIDLGVMVETARIVEEAQKHNVDAIGLSGLISPSLNVMVEVAQALKDAGIRVPLFVGGAATNDEFAAIKLAPAYAPGIACHIADASRVPGVIGPWLAEETKNKMETEILQKHDHIRTLWHQKVEKISLRSLEQSRAQAPKLQFEQTLVQSLTHVVSHGCQNFEWTLAELIDRIQWKRLVRVAGHKSCHCPECAENLESELVETAKRIAAVAAQTPDCLVTRARLQFVNAKPKDEDIVLLDKEGKTSAVLYGFRAQDTKLKPLALADFVAPKNGVVGLFALTCHVGTAKIQIDGIEDDWIEMILSTLATALVDIANDVLHELAVAPLGAYICPACGYPISPDHTLKTDILQWLKADEMGIQLTPSGMMQPLASICGFTLVHPETAYFSLGTIGDDQWTDYAQRRGLDVATVKRYCGK